MLILIVAIIVALISFAILRKLALPMILLLGAGYLYIQFQGISSGQATQVAGSPTAEFQLPVPVPMPATEATVCKALEDARDAFSSLKAEFKAAETERNVIRRDQLIAQARGKIDRLYSDRNRAVLTGMGWDVPRAGQWVMKLTGLSAMTKDYGKGAASYASLRAELPCRIPVMVNSEDFPAASRLGETLATVNEGDAILVSGSFVKHDATMNPQEVAIEWGGPLYGPFGGLWSDAIDAPAFRIVLTEVATVSR